MTLITSRPCSHKVSVKSELWSLFGRCSVFSQLTAAFSIRVNMHIGYYWQRRNVIFLFFPFFFFTHTFIVSFPKAKKHDEIMALLKKQREDRITVGYFVSVQLPTCTCKSSNKQFVITIPFADLGRREEEPYRQPSVLFLSYPLECSDSLISTISSKPQHFPLSIPCRGTAEWSGKQLIMDLNVFRGKRMKSIWLALAVFSPNHD